MAPLWWHGQSLFCLPERGIYWPRQNLGRLPEARAPRDGKVRGVAPTFVPACECESADGEGGEGGGVLIVADLHLGKTAAFRAGGVPVPEVIDAELLALSLLADRLRPDVLLIAGDLLHARTGTTERVLNAMRRWRARHAEIEVILVRGNHDLSAGDPPKDLDIRTVAEPFVLHEDDPIAFAHDPAVARECARPVICGHLHPSVSLRDGPASMRAPCFWVRPHELIVPAYGRFTGTRNIRPGPRDRCLAVGPGVVVEVRPAARIAGEAGSRCRTGG
ncbi:MAG: ligase-associated DNA damage response endonuclease PdeM [Phycisphaerales bacterium]